MANLTSPETGITVAEMRELLNDPRLSPGSIFRMGFYSEEDNTHKNVVINSARVEPSNQKRKTCVMLIQGESDL